MNTNNSRVAIVPLKRHNPTASSSALTLEDLERIEENQRRALHQAEQGAEELVRSYRLVLAERDSLALECGSLKRRLGERLDEANALTDGKSKEWDSISDECQTLRSTLVALTKEKADLQQAYDRDKEHWMKFKGWWDDKLRLRQSNGGKRSKLTDEDRAVLESVGMTSSPSTPLAPRDPEPLQPHLLPSAGPRTAQCGPAQKVDVHTPLRLSEMETAAVPSLSFHDPGTTREGHLATMQNATLPSPRVAIDYKDANQPAEITNRINDWLGAVDDQSEQMSDSNEREIPAKISSEVQARPAPLPTVSTTGNHDSERREDRIGTIEESRDSTGLKRRRVNLLEEIEAPNETREGKRTSTRASNLPSSPISPPKRPREDEVSPLAIDITPHPQVIMSESDDEVQKTMARDRAGLVGQEEGQTRKEILRRRKKDMEDLRANPWKYRGHGRYAAELKRKYGIAANYELDPKLNGGADYEHVDVVRDRSTRKQMHAFGCPCCKDYWDLVGRPAVSPVPIRRTVKEKNLGALVSLGGLTVTSVASRRTEVLDSSDEDAAFRERQEERARLIAIDEEEREQSRLADERRQRAGKHRAWGQPEPTPEGYWDIGFPDTPRKQAINDSAQKQSAEKEWQVQRDKRYRQRKTFQNGQIQ